jgi:hypothetical protein
VSPILDDFSENQVVARLAARAGAHRHAETGSSRDRTVDPHGE